MVVLASTSHKLETKKVVFLFEPEDCDIIRSVLSDLSKVAIDAKGIRQGAFNC